MNKFLLLVILAIALLAVVISQPNVVCVDLKKLKTLLKQASPKPAKKNTLSSEENTLVNQRAICLMNCEDEKYNCINRSCRIYYRNCDNRCKTDHYYCKARCNGRKGY